MFLDRVVVPFLEANRLKYAKGGHGLLIPFGGTDHLDGRINEEEDKKPGRMAIIVTGMVRFEPEDNYVLKLVDELNGITVGKWKALDDGEVVYILDMLTVDGFGQEAFKEYFDLALVTGTTFKDKLLAVRYGGMSLRRALSGKSNRRVERSKKSVRKLVEEALGSGESEQGT